MSFKVIQDSIYGQIELDEFLFKLIDTENFQRLRNVAQTGNAKYVFPNAAHSRFTHSIGTAHVTEVWMDHLIGPVKCDELSRHRLLVTTAGLCHDLGHGPFSHSFDKCIARKLGFDLEKPFGWNHEQRSCEIVEKTVDSEGIDIDTEEMAFIKRAILGKESCGVNSDFVSKHQHLLNIVCNPLNGIDADKFDYIERDSYEAGLKSSFQASRLIKMSRVIDGEICFQRNTLHDIYELCKSRQILHRKVYSHKTVQAIDLMVADIFLHADSVFGFSDTIKNRDLESFLKLDDTIIQTIKSSPSPALEKSQELIRRIERRDLYKLAGEVILSERDFKRFKDNFAAEKLVSHCKTAKVEDIEVCMFELARGIDFNDSLRNTKFYSGDNFEEKHSVDPLECELVNGKIETPFFVRCYVKDSKHLNDAKNAFKRLTKTIKNF